MIIGIANDHHGVNLKNKIINYLKQSEIKYIDFGCSSESNVDYIDYAESLCKEINNHKIDLGILICGTGIGMSIVANKIKGIRCAKVSSSDEARLSKEHNMANVIALSEYTQNVEEIIAEFINTKNSTEERHIRRVEKIKNIENNNK